MAEMIELKEIQEKVILVSVSTSDNDDTQKSLDELEELAATAGAVTVGRGVQNICWKRKIRRNQGLTLGNRSDRNYLR